MPTISFFPWFAVHNQMDLGKIRLLPYVRGERPFGYKATEQKIADGFIGHFYTSKDTPVEKATILELPNKQRFEDYTEDEIEFLFVAIELLALCCLSNRQFFGMGLSYYNRDYFNPIVQRFIKDDNFGVAITTRQRDGRRTVYHQDGCLAQNIPENVRPGNNISINAELLSALFTAAEKLEDWLHIYDSILNFNRANTDSPFIHETHEIVMLTGAYQRLLGCESSSENELVNKFLDIFNPKIFPLPTSLELNASSRLQNWNNKPSTLREVWIKDLYRLRGDPAHGRCTGVKYPSRWKVCEHLLLSSYLFPLLLKIKLKNVGLYNLNTQDLEDINVFELLADADLTVSPLDQKSSTDTMWQRIRKAHTFETVLDTALEDAAKQYLPDEPD